MREHRSRSPVKKSRALSTPAEVDENDNEEQVENFVDASRNEGPTPSPQPSLPDEPKVCQTSQGSEDISRRNRQSTPQADIDITSVITAPNDSAPLELQTQIGTKSTILNLEIQNKSGPTKVPVAEEVDPSIPIAEAALADSSESLSAPPIATVPSAIEEKDDNVTTSTISQPAATPPRDLDSSPSKELTGDDASSDSSTKVTKQSTPPHSEVDGASKRPREDDGDVDPNPREPKRASPPPEKDTDKKNRPAKKKNGSEVHTPSAPTSPRIKSASVFVSHSSSDLLGLLELTRTQGGGGFLAYAAVSSPFAAVKGPNIFGASSAPSGTTSSSTTTTTTITSTPNSNTTPILTTAPSTLGSPPRTVPSSPVQRAASPTPAKRTGFEAFASAASPLVSAAARARSPVRRSGSPGPGTGARSNPFAIYATGGTQSLFGTAGAPAAKRARGDSESTAPGECGAESSSWREGIAGPEKTFGERLRAGSGSGGDEEDEPDNGSGVLGENIASAKWAEQEGKFSFSASLLQSSLIVDFYSSIDRRRRGRDDTQRTR